MRIRECGSSLVNGYGSSESRRDSCAGSSRGFTVMEMLLVITILGITMTIGLPRMSAGVTSANVRGARTTLINLLARARIAATQSNRVAVLKIEGNNAVILLRPRLAVGAGTADTLGAVAQLGEAYGVTVTGAIDSVRFDPRGLASGFGTGTSFQVSRYGTTETIRIDGLGRVTK
jgi:prepilin-type N-terminal cleavage/methylation domain-containing protein